MIYQYKQTEVKLLTVGFNTPDGVWIPESDHGSEYEARNRCDYLNGPWPYGDKVKYVCRETEPGELWTIGFYDGIGRWIPTEDVSTAHDAADRVHCLNGGGKS
jgi:hypothetical protein